MDLVLIPGLWLDASSWDAVVPVLERAGRRAHPVTLPGTESSDADRSGITLADHVDAVVAAIDALDPEPVVLVGHSAGAGIAHAAVDARPARVDRAVYVGGFPTGRGQPVVDGFAVVDDGIPLPDWSSFDDADLAGLDESDRAAFRARAVPSAACLAHDVQQLGDERRYDVPVTVVCTEFTAAMLREWIDDGLDPVRELAAIREVELVDLPTGHWPQLTRPDDLGQLLVRLLR